MLEEFLHQSASVVVIVGTAILASMAYAFIVRSQSFSKWMSKTGKGSMASAGLGVGSIIAVAFILFLHTQEAQSEGFSNGSWLNSTSVFLGIDRTMKQSPQCVTSNVDDHSTSNLGVNQNIWRSEKKIFDINAQYTHHSCVLGKDRNTYDALGLELVWHLYRK